MKGGFLDLGDYLLARKYCSYGLGVLFALLSCVAAASSALFFARERSRWTNGKTLVVSVAITAVCRAGFWFLLPETSRSMSGEVLVLWTVPGVQLFSVFTILIYRWADVQAQISEPDANATKPFRIWLCCGVNAVVWGVQGLLFALLFLDDNRQESGFRHREPIFLTVIYLLCFCGIVMYGLATLNRLNRLPASSASSAALLRVRTVTSILALAFFVRSVVNLAWVRIIQPMEDSVSPWYWLFLGLFYLFVEVVPLVVVLGWAGQPPRRLAGGAPVLRGRLKKNSAGGTRSGSGEGTRQQGYDDAYFLYDDSAAIAAGGGDTFSAARATADMWNTPPRLPSSITGFSAGPHAARGEIQSFPPPSLESTPLLNSPDSVPSSPFQLPPSLQARSYGTKPSYRVQQDE